MAFSFTANSTPRLRKVPWPLYVSLLLGGVPQLFGWLFFGFGVIFVQLMNPQSELCTSYQYLGHLERAQGRVADVWNTGATENDQAIIGVHYTFSPSGAPIWRGTSYTRDTKPELGTPVTVEYRPDNPTVSRVVGMRAAQLPIYAGLFALIFPIIGLIFTLVECRTGWKQIFLMRCGVMTMARFLGMRATRREINDRQLMAVDLTFTSADGHVYPVEYRTTEPDPIWDISVCAPSAAKLNALGKVPLIGGWLREASEQYCAKRLPEGESVPDVPLLYDPANPRRTLLLRDLDQRVTFTDTQVSGGSPLRDIGVLIILTLVTLGNVLFLVKLVFY